MEIPGAIDRSEKLILPSTVMYYQRMEDEFFVSFYNQLTVIITF